MNSSGKRRSKRFVPDRWLQRLVPILLALLLLGLIFTILVVILAVLGVLPGT